MHKNNKYQNFTTLIKLGSTAKKNLTVYVVVSKLRRKPRQEIIHKRNQRRRYVFVSKPHRVLKRYQY